MVQVAFIAAVSVCAMLAMPYFYQHRMNDSAFTVGIVAFAGIPLTVGIVQKHAHRSILPIAIILLFFCPVAYAVTDPLPVEFEESRDAYFLTTFSAIVFVSAVWLASSLRLQKRAIAVAALFGLVASAVGIYILLAVVMYLE